MTRGPIVPEISIIEANDLGLVVTYRDDEGRDAALALALQTIAVTEGVSPVRRYDVAEAGTAPGQPPMHASAETIGQFLPLLRGFVSFELRHSVFHVWLDGTGRRYVFAHLAESDDGFSFGPAGSVPEGWGRPFLETFERLRSSSNEAG